MPRWHVSSNLPRRKRLVDHCPVPHATPAKDFANCGDGSGRAIVLCDLQQRRRGCFFGCGDESRAYVRVPIPGQCAARLILRNSKYRVMMPP